MRKTIWLAACLLIFTVINSSAANKPNDKPSILKDILSDTLIDITQDASLASLLDFSPVERVKKESNLGYRVQVFSDNNQRTAKNEARVKQRNIRSRFPAYDSYVTYTAPYWRLRVGDFKTQEEANAAAAAIRRAFPAYAREVRVVRDRVKTSK